MSAKAAFGTLKHNMYQSDYLNKKKGIITRCHSRCKPNSNSNTYFSMNKYNLIIGQYSEMNLKDVVTVDSIVPPVVINPDETEIPFYYTNTIDPYGQLFGN